MAQRMELKNQQMLDDLRLTQKVLVQNEFTGEDEERKIETTDDLRREFLGFVLNKTKKAYMTATNQTPEQVSWISEKKVVCGIAVPTCWTAKTIIKSRAMLAAAGYPDCTIILGESKAVAAFSAIRGVQKTRSCVHGTKEAHQALEKWAQLPRTGLMVADVGGGSTDVGTVSVLCDDHDIKVGELIPGSGSLCGSLSMNELFRNAMNVQQDAYLRYVEGRYCCPREVILDALCHGFEDWKVLGREGLQIAYKLPGPAAPAAGPFSAQQVEYALVYVMDR
jgi:hypothetical protein